MNTCVFNSFSLMQCLLLDLKYSSPELKYQVNYFFCILWKFSIAFQNLFVPQTVREMLVFFLIMYSTQPLCWGQLLFISLNTYLQVPFKIIFPHTVVSVARKIFLRESCCCKSPGAAAVGCSTSAHWWLSRGRDQPGTMGTTFSLHIWGLRWVTGIINTRGGKHPVFHSVSSVVSLLYKSAIIIF